MDNYFDDMTKTGAGKFGLALVASIGLTALLMVAVGVTAIFDWLLQ